MRITRSNLREVFGTFVLIALIQFSLAQQTLTANCANVSQVEGAPKFDDLVSELKANPESKGLVLISVGNDLVRVSNVFGYKDR